MYSQNKEEEYILNYFGDFKGRLCDIGANDGKTFSNSKALIERGWGGVLVEPSPGAYAACATTHKDNQDIHVVNTAIGKESGFAKFFDGADSLVSSLIEDKTKAWNTPITEVEVPIWTWRDFLLFHPGPYHFITIDAEGMDWDILQQIDLSETELVCVEYVNDDIEKYFRYCSEFGMKIMYTCFENVIMGK